MKRITWLLTVFIVAGMLLAACAAPATQSPTTTEAPKPTEVTKPTEASAKTEEPAATEEPMATEEPVMTEAPGTVPDLGGKTITVAVENAYPPFNSIDETTNEGVGWDYDSVREICKRLNCVADFKQAAWDGIFPAMQAGEYDVLADGVTITAERAQIVDFSIPYVTVGQVLLVRADETRTVDEFKADANALIGTQIGTTNEKVALDHFPQERIKSFEDFPAAVLALNSKDVDAVVIDNLSASGFMREDPGKMKIVGTLTSDEQLGFVFPPGSELKAAFDAALQSMMDDGTLEKINRTWGLIE
jgi:polar amino acid transport system substrate-binding protein